MAKKIYLVRQGSEPRTRFVASFSSRDDAIAFAQKWNGLAPASFVGRKWVIREATRCRVFEFPIDAGPRVSATGAFVATIYADESPDTTWRPKQRPDAPARVLTDEYRNRVIVGYGSTRNRALKAASALASRAKPKTSPRARRGRRTSRA